MKSSFSARFSADFLMKEFLPFSYSKVCIFRRIPIISKFVSLESTSFGNTIYLVLLSSMRKVTGSVNGLGLTRCARCMS